MYTITTVLGNHVAAHRAERNDAIQHAARLARRERTHFAVYRSAELIAWLRP